jgi:hypothetical protein
MGENPTREMWERESQQGGLLHTAFGGKPPPFEQAPQVIEMARSRRDAGPDDQEMLDLGFTPEQIQAGKRARALESRFGKPKVGHVWDVDDAGRVFQREVKERDDKGSIPPAQLEFNLENLRRSFDVITGGVDPQTGKLKGGGPWMPTRAIANSPAGGYLTPALSEAYKNAEHAALTLSYALSGKQVGQREQAMIREFFVPAPTDSDEMAAFKLNASHTLFQTLLDAKRKGIGDAKRSDLFDSALVSTARRMRELQGGDTYQRKDQDRAPARSGKTKALYDKYGLE